MPDSTSWIKRKFEQTFWRLRKRHNTSVISVGENGYKHPSLDVINFFEKTINYEVHSTNLTGALKYTIQLD
ncbi:MAG: hypothetical protein R2753_12350 [Chitinophagales bacterium]